MSEKKSTIEKLGPDVYYQMQGGRLAIEALVEELDACFDADSALEDFVNALDLSDETKKKFLQKRLDRDCRVLHRAQDFAEKWAEGYHDMCLRLTETKP